MPHFYPVIKGERLNSTSMLEQGMNILGGDDVSSMSDDMAPMDHLGVPLDISKSGLSTDLGRPLSFQCHLVISPVFLSATRPFSIATLC